jgi:cytochrome c oxidase assembly protein subunit 15
MLAYCAWGGTDHPWRVTMEEAPRARLRFAVILLLVLVVAEGITGSQVREMTDEMAKFHDNAPRETWIGELEGSWAYLFHRSFSWAILAGTVWPWWLARRHQQGGPGRVAHTVLAIVLAQMVLGVVMAQIHIYSWVQVLHVGLAAVLLTFIWLWLFGLSRGKPTRTSPISLAAE